MAAKVMPEDVAIEVIDVFTLADGSGGNPLGLRLDGLSLDARAMQRTAATLGHSETIFLSTGRGGSAVAARIFTPGVEVPFAGHPLVGAAWRLGRSDRTSPFVITTAAGAVHCWYDPDTGMATIQAPRMLSRFAAPTSDQLAPCLRLEAGAIASEPVGLSIGLPFIVVEVRDRRDLGSAEVDIDLFREALAPTGADSVLCWTAAENDDHDVDARMFSPLDGIGEDPATGSACGALAANLAASRGGPLSIRVRQGEDMGQPCDIFVEVDAAGAIRLSGRCSLSRSV